MKIRDDKEGAQEPTGFVVDEDQPAERIHIKQTPMKNVALRVGVKTEDGRQSQTFKIWTYRAAHQVRDDIYIQGRSMGDWMKVSLHASGLRQVGLTAPHARRTRAVSQQLV